MTDIFDMAGQRTPLRVINEGPPASSCVRSPRSRLSPRAIVGRPESRQGDLHLAALPLYLEACPPTSMTIGGFCSWTSRAAC
jgi:hypothetical protein